MFNSYVNLFDKLYTAPSHWQKLWSVSMEDPRNRKKYTPLLHSVSGIVTRCPLVLRLKSTVQFAGQWKGHIQYIDSEKESVSEDIDNPEEVTQYIEKGRD